MITVYAKPRGCAQCDATKRYLDRQGLKYRVVDVTQDDDARTRLVSQGYSSVPVVDPGDGRPLFTGFRLDHLRALTTNHKEHP